MKKIIIEVENEGLVALMGEEVVIYAGVFIYSGVLDGVNDKFIRLTGARVVYDTGPLQGKEFLKDEETGTAWYVMTHAIESFGLRHKG